MPSLMKCINIISRCGAIFRSDRLAGTDLGENHHSYILTLCRNPGISQDTLSKMLFINKSNVTRTLAGLEAAGYVRREQSEKDRRVILVRPTEKAYAALPGIREMLRDWNEYIAADLTDEEKDSIRDILPKMALRAAEYAEHSGADLGEDVLPPAGGPAEGGGR